MTFEDGLEQDDELMTTVFGVLGISSSVRKRWLRPGSSRRIAPYGHTANLYKACRSCGTIANYHPSVPVDGQVQHAVDCKEEDMQFFSCGSCYMRNLEQGVHGHSPACPFYPHNYGLVGGAGVLAFGLRTCPSPAFDCPEPVRLARDCARHIIIRADRAVDVEIRMG